MSTSMMAEVFPVLRDEKADLIMDQVTKARKRFDLKLTPRSLASLNAAEKAFADLHPFDPPTRAMLVRAARGERLGHLPPARMYKAPSAEVLQSRKQLDFHKRVIAQLGGSRTVVAAAETGKIPSFTREIAAPARTEARPMTDAEKNRPLRRAHIQAMSKLVYTEYEPDMFDVLDAFGSFATYGEALK